MHEFYDFLHIGGVGLFFGGVIVSLARLFFAEKRGQSNALRVAAKQAHMIDMFATAPGIIAITVSGFLQAPYVGGGLFSQSWLIAGLTLFALSALVWLIFFIPAHYKLLHIAATSDDPLPADFFTTLHRLYFFGAIIIMLPLGTMALSIMKPHLW